jgi:hypothetical protein
VQCAKQPYDSVLCGFYVCEYLKTYNKFSSSWRQLKKAQDWWRREKVDQDFKQTVADVCKFITESVHEGNTFFNWESELAQDPKFESIRNWSDKLRISDYIMPDLFSDKK